MTQNLPWPFVAARISKAFIDIVNGQDGGSNSFGMATVLLSQLLSSFDWGISWDTLECNFDEGLDSAVNWARISSAMEVASACFGDNIVDISLSCKCSDTKFWMSLGRSESVEDVWTDDDDNDVPLDVWDLDVTLMPWVSLEECWFTEGTPLSMSRPPEMFGLGNRWVPGSPDKAATLLELLSCNQIK